MVFLIPAGTRPAICRGCRAEIFWVITRRGKRQPLEVRADVDGCRRPNRQQDGAGVAHHAFCPKVTLFRKPAPPKDLGEGRDNPEYFND